MEAPHKVLRLVRSLKSPLTRDFLSFSACLGESDCYGLLAALHLSAASPTFERASLTFPHRALHICRSASRISTCHNASPQNVNSRDTSIPHGNPMRETLFRWSQLRGTVLVIIYPAAICARAVLPDRLRCRAAALRLILRLARPFSFLSVAFSSFRFMVNTLPTSLWPRSLAHATKVP
jgi:hypothetical protein